jgi:hypothetical protein
VGGVLILEALFGLQGLAPLTPLPYNQVIASFSLMSSFTSICRL